jgi:putrescine:ornithine antiporter
MEGSTMMQPHRSTRPAWRPASLACLTALLAVGSLVLAQAPSAPQAKLSPQATVSPQAAPGSALSRIRESGRIRLGYRTDARPFSYRDDAGQPAGYSVALCQRIADSGRTDPAMSGVKPEWVPIAVAERFQAVQQGQVDVFCSGETMALSRRTEVSFSIPIFPGGIGALVRADAPARLRDVLAGRGRTDQPVWRASAARTLQARAFSAVAATTSEKWLRTRIGELQVIADVSPVASYDAGVEAVLARRSDALFGERAILLDAARRHPSSRDLLVIDRTFTYEPLAMAVPRGDEDLRLFVDRGLSRMFRSGDLGGLYAKWFGEPDEAAISFFRWNTLPE